MIFFFFFFFFLSLTRVNGGSVNVRSHINGGEEQVPAKTLVPEGGWIVRIHIDWRGEQHRLEKGTSANENAGL